MEDLNELSTKQIKDLLAMNRVNFKGCVEKEELLKILQRLWKQDKRNKENIETMDDDSLCKICMDSPVIWGHISSSSITMTHTLIFQIDCVMLECGHMCTCTNCGKQMAECPICRQYVVRWGNILNVTFPNVRYISQSCQDFQSIVGRSESRTGRR